MKVEIKLTEHEIKRIMANRDWYMSAQPLLNTAGDLMCKKIIAAIEKERAK